MVVYTECEYCKEFSSVDYDGDFTIDTGNWSNKSDEEDSIDGDK